MPSGRQLWKQRQSSLLLVLDSPRCIAAAKKIDTKNYNFTDRGEVEYLTNTRVADNIFSEPKNPPKNIYLKKMSRRIFLTQKKNGTPCY